MTHPVTGEILRLTAPVPADMARLVPEPTIHFIEEDKILC